MIVDRVNRAIDSIVDEYGEILVTNLKRNLVDLGKYASGSLVDTISYEVKTVDGKAVLRMSAESYLRFVDKGRKPGTFPNIRAISKWASVKGIAQDAVFPIARAISQRGIPKTDVINKTIKQTEEAFLPIYEKQLKNLVGVVLVEDVFSKTNTKGQMIPKNLR